MYSKVNNYFSYYSRYGFTKETHKAFIEWRQEQTYKQITIICFVTALLYTLLSSINRLTAPQHVADFIANLQLFIPIPYMFLVSYLAYKKTKFLYIENLLLLAPFLAASFHVLILSKFDNYNIYQVELYLMIFWIFNISGLRLIPSTIAALFAFMMGVLSAYFLYPDNLAYFLIHVT